MGESARASSNDLRSSARDRDLKQARANRAWLDEAAEHGAADLDFSAVVATIVGQEPPVTTPAGAKTDADKR